MRILILLFQGLLILKVASTVGSLPNYVVNLSVGLPSPELVFTILLDKLMLASVAADPNHVNAVLFRAKAVKEVF